jgi:UDP-N-acetylmuramoyl-tripeptide--D-alanyl-D-alanine ligase
MSLDIYRNISTWKKPFHRIRAFLAKHWAKLNRGAEIIGVTGSVGKTTTKEAILKVLGERFKVLGTIGNLDPVFNIPITLLKIRPWTKKIVLELGVEYPGEMDFYLSLAKPKIGVVTRIYWTHTEFLGDLEGVINEKGKLLEALPKDGWAVLNDNDEYIREMAKKTKASIFWFGTHPHCQVQIADFHQEKEGSEFVLKNGGESVKIKWKLLGEHNTVSAAAACSVGILAGLKLGEIKKGLEKLEPQPHRLNLVSGPNESFILDDSYNSSPVAAIMALETLRSLAHKSKAFAVLGDMLELGNYSEEGHREVGQKVVQENIDYLFTIGREAKIIADEAQKFGAKNVDEARDWRKITEKLRNLVGKDDIILVKGSRATNLDKLVLDLTAKIT